MGPVGGLTGMPKTMHRLETGFGERFEAENGSSRRNITGWLFQRRKPFQGRASVQEIAFARHYVLQSGDAKGDISETCREMDLSLAHRCVGRLQRDAGRRL